MYGQVQEKDEQKILWKSEKKRLVFEKNEKYKGPKNWGTTEPGSFNTEKIERYDNYNEYDAQQIKENRKLKNEGIDQQNGDGDYYEEEEEEIDTDEVKEEKRSTSSSFSISTEVWQVLGALILFSLLIFIIYQIIQNKRPSNTKIISTSFEDDWNPEMITKTQLELLLDKSIDEEDYRSCIRIYFTFILKELIRKGWIKWKKEKTNYDYILEMKSKSNSKEFEESVQIFELVWYGEYMIDKPIFDSIQPKMNAFYILLKGTNE